MESPNSTLIPIVTAAKLPWETPLLLPLDLAQGTAKINNYATEASRSSGPGS